MSTNELPDFNTAPVWVDALGGVVTRGQIMGYRGPLSDFSAGAPWAPLMTVKDWAKQRDDIDTAAAELSERTLMTASEAMAVLIAATDWIGAEKLTREEWVQRIDSGKLAEMLKPYFNGGDVAYGEHIECAEAVLAALPELMGGGER